MWQQIYDPMNNIWLSALIAFLPILCFLVCLVFFKLKGFQAGFLTVIVASLVALLAYKMPWNLVGASFIQGFINGMWPIAWIIIAAIFLYKLSIKSGSFEVIKKSVMSITPDHRMQVILIGFCFGSFLEGAIGFGGPIAITAALLVGLGFKPLQAAGLCLIANTAPVAFGAVGIPVIAMCDLVKIESQSVSAMIGRMLIPLSFIVPFFVVFLMNGFKGIKETFPAVFVAATSFTLTQYLSSNYLGAELPSIISAVASLAITTLFLKFWKIKNIYRVDGETNFETNNNLSFSSVLKAWAPFILLIVCIIFWTQPWFKDLFGKDGIFAFTSITIAFNNITQGILSPSIVDASVLKPVSLNLGIDFINGKTVAQAGTAILFAAFFTIFILKIKASDAAECFGATLKEMAIPCLTIGLVVAFAFISKNSGMSATLGLAFAHTGDIFSFFSPAIGWIGVFLTGSDTSANLLFGTLQQATAQKLGVNEVLFLAANSVGGVVGKMISPQSIAVACAAVGLVGKESELFKFTLKYSIAFIILVGIWTCFIAFFLQDIIPSVVLK
ncbi:MULTISPECIES: L-lactate permease [Campylobacter]|uniref:L-lactate permease n=1 Tax=Campylobacter TaxID=194 RepID=UPI001D74567E|nr:L-lactate permease [Campylobacter sp. RM12910]MBZ7934709.1 L-lactate permease [Campylobacter sp. W0065]MBZ7959479.1 L-lactate permease [Campylobacter sp. RM12397]MBZ7961604.1 L-lactate permease [Campylobacter sp. RM9930]MBZ7967637.1 L-lactate permease [Campylobacter sp. RM9756]MBZ7968326.1 L-lactate permease [Campylobacter sp. RM9759]MBZ7969578.1 L-lactate permease [Campylobacter sp. RM3125]MBZ7971221.1 L-lactate permease [Campylobacter sp. RM3124]MBZ7973031.1 L-lactate permease [Campylo